MLPNAVHFKEFYGGFTGTCGETALTAALICAERIPDSHDQAVALMLAITHEMQQMGWASANGASTLWALAREASQKRGASIALEWDYAEPFPHDWHAEFLADAGYKPIVVELANAQALPGDEAGVHYHFVCVVGRSPAGYIVMDGDNWAIEQNFVTYSYADFAAAQPCGVLVLNEAGAPAPTPAPTPQPKGPIVITIEKDSSGNITGATDSTNGNHVGLGFATEIEKNGETDATLDTPEIFGLAEHVTACVLRGTVKKGYTYNPSSNSIGVFTGDVVDVVDDQYHQSADLAKQVTSLQEQVAALQAQLAQAGSLSSAAKSALLSAHQLLAPFTAADAEVEKALNS